MSLLKQNSRNMISKEDLIELDKVLGEDKFTTPVREMTVDNIYNLLANLTVFRPYDDIFANGEWQIVWDSRGICIGKIDEDIENLTAFKWDKSEDWDENLERISKEMYDYFQKM